MRGHPNAVGGRTRGIAEAFLQISGYRQVGGLDDGFAVRHRLLARHIAVEATEHAGTGAGGGGDCLKAEPGEDAG